MIPIQKVRSYLNIEGTEHDALLANLIERTISYAENVLNSPLERREIVKLKQIERSRIWLDEIEPNVKKVERLTDREFEEVDFVQNGQLVVLTVPLLRGIARVTMDAGFVQIPSAIEFAIVKEVAYEFLLSLQGEGRLGKKSISDNLGGRAVSTSFSPSEFEQELKKWRTR